MIVPPRLRSPARWAASIMGSPIRSFTDPPGLSVSSFARSSGWVSSGPRSLPGIRVSRTSGVSPTRSRMDSAYRMRSQDIGRRGAVHNPGVHPIVAAAALVAAAIHVGFFVLESILFMQPRVFRRFGLASEDEARVVRSFAYNQGFYNLFLAAGAIGGVAKSLTGDPEGGVPVVLFACG